MNKPLVLAPMAQCGVFFCELFERSPGGNQAVNRLWIEPGFPSEGLNLLFKETQRMQKGSIFILESIESFHSGFEAI